MAFIPSRQLGDRRALQSWPGYFGRVRGAVRREAWCLAARLARPPTVAGAPRRSDNPRSAALVAGRFRRHWGVGVGVRLEPALADRSRRADEFGVAVGQRVDPLAGAHADPPGRVASG